MRPPWLVCHSSCIQAGSSCEASSRALAQHEDGDSWNRGTGLAPMGYPKPWSRESGRATRLALPARLAFFALCRPFRLADESTGG